MDGLWQGPTALTQDFGIVAYRIQLLGFNAIRLPFSFQVWPSYIHISVNFCRLRGDGILRSCLQIQRTDQSSKAAAASESPVQD